MGWWEIGEEEEEEEEEEMISLLGFCLLFDVADRHENKRKTIETVNERGGET